MNRRLYSAACGLLTAAALMAGGCSGTAPASTEDGDERPRATVVDGMGRERTVPRPLERVVTLGGTTTEIIWALDEQATIVARSEWTNWPPPMRAVPSIGYSHFPNLEQLWRLKPDVVFADTHFWSVVDQVEAMGIPVMFFNGYTLTEIPAAIQGLGRVYGCENRARALLADWRSMLDLAAGRMAGVDAEERPTAFHGFGEHLYFTSTIKSGKRMIIDAGGVNIADVLPLPWQFVSPEWVVCQNPDFFIFGADLGSVRHAVAGRAHMADLRRDAMARPGIRHLDAVKAERVQMMNHRVGYGLRAPIGVLAMAKRFHPDRFADIDPEAVHRRFLQKYFDMTLDGVYVYP